MKNPFYRCILTLFCCAALVTSCASPEQENETATVQKSGAALSVRDCMAFAEKQLEKTVGKVKDGSRFPRFIKDDGTWETTDSSAWSSGFFAGCLWLMYEHTGDEQWKGFAETWTHSMEEEKFCTSNHNNGFKMMSSFGHGYRLTGNDHYRDVVVESARSLAKRFKRTVGMIKANEMEQWRFPVMIDTMVNLELLFWAARNGGHSDYYELAETHALNTIKHHIRDDGSTIQVVDFDPDTGEVLGHDTLCGLSGDSGWLRGQGQALYGFSMAYRETGNPEFLAAAQKVADYFIAALPDDYVPYWDASDPAIPDAMRDASAGAIAADGLLELCTQVTNGTDRERYKTAAINILASLCSPAYRADSSKSYGIVTHATWKKPTDPQADTSLIWGDYNFLEAMMRYKRGIAQTVEAGLQKKIEKIKAFCIDFNWGENGFAPPGMYANASPEEHLKWYRDLGVNTIQTFCTNCCGYAWFRSDVAPVQPGMQGDFLKEITELGHKEGMRVMGYFCVGANTYWGETHPGLSYGTPSSTHIPLTTEYLDYLCAVIEDVLTKTDIDGFMIDWMFHVIHFDKLKWLDCEKKMYGELFGEPFPGVAAIDGQRETEFRRRSVERAWERIRKAAKSTKSDCIIWLSSHKLDHPQVAGLSMLREVDWLMNEHPDPSILKAVRKAVGPHASVIQCLSGWGDQHDAAKILGDPRYGDVGFYGFARPDEQTTLPPTESDNPNLAGNARNIEIIRKAFRL